MAVSAPAIVVPQVAAPVVPAPAVVLRPSCQAERWLSGGIEAAAVVAAYEPVGAASLAASYLNKANPGTYDAAPGTAPTHAQGTGWTFNGTNQHLVTGIVPQIGWSMFVRFTDYSGTGHLAGCMKSGANDRFYLRPSDGANVVYGAGQNLGVSPTHATGSLAVGGQQGYRDGAADGAEIGAWGANGTYALVIGAFNANDALSLFGAFSLQYLYVYNRGLTAAEVAALHAATAPEAG